jgi:putative redox protein
MSDAPISPKRTISAEVRQDGSTSSQGTVRGHSVRIDRPRAKGGSDQGPMGGELLLLALGGCFMSNLIAAVGARDSAADSFRVLVEARLAGTPERMSEFTIRVGGRYGENDQMAKLVVIAERGCLVANTLRGIAPVNVVLEDSLAE